MPKWSFVLLQVFFLSPVFADFETVRPIAIDAGVRPYVWEDAINFFKDIESEITNKRYLTFFDVSVHSGKKRLFIVDVKNDEVQTYFVAHGRGSDENHDGYATDFSNIVGSKMTSLGFYLTAETYNGQHGFSLKLDGLQETNSNARARAIVIHGADYVNPNWPKMGRSFGCPAVEKKLSTTLINKLKNGSLLYIYQ